MSKVNSTVRSFLLAAVVALGLAMAWAIVVACLLGIVQSANTSHSTYEQLCVGLDGEPYILRYVSGVYTPVQEVATLTRQPAAIDTLSLLHPTYVAPRSGMPSVVGWAWRARLAAVNDGGSPAQYWYLVHDGQPGGRAYGVGYDAFSKRVVGYFGRQGFTDRLPPRSAWFEIAGNNGLSYATPNVAVYEPSWGQDRILHFLADGKLWAADPRGRQVRELATVPRDAAIGWAWDLSAGPQMRPREPQVNAASAPRQLLVRGDETCLLVDPESGDAATFSLPAELRNATFGGVSLPDEKLLLIAYGNSFAQTGYQVVWLGSPDDDVKRQVVHLAQFGGVESGPAAVGWMSAAAAPLAVGQLPAMFLFPLALFQSGQTDSYGAAFVQMLGHTWPAFLAVAAIGAVSAAAAYRRQQRFGLSHAWGWAAFAFLFGAPGWIAYRYRGAWPVLNVCPACGHVVPHDRDHCTECRAAFPPPVMKGSEVFA